MKISDKQLQAVLALPAAARFAHFVKAVADSERVWGLYADGWALSSDDDGCTVFPLWPAPDYAKLCALGEWSSYEPRPIEIDELLDILLPRLQRDGVLPGIFVTPLGKGMTPSVEELTLAIKTELQKY
ncbi:DUF2750 domain-containing protein [Bradyrhizobium sp. USDA 4353]